MVNPIRIKRRAAGGAAGAPATLIASELAFNEQDNTLYYGKGNSAGNATSIIPIAGSGGFLPLSGGTISGSLTITNTLNVTQASNLSGVVTLALDPVNPLEAATKRYADTKLSIAGGTVTGDVTFNNGITLGSTVAPGGVADVSRHIAMFGTTFGLGITSARLNYVVPNAATHRFVVNAADAVTIGGTGLTMGAATDITLARNATSAMHAVAKQQLDGIGVPAFANVAALRAASPSTSLAYVSGYAVAGDDGQGTNLLVTADTTSADNGGMVVIDASGRRWHRDTPDGEIYVEWFGAKGDGITDDTTAINNAVLALPVRGGVVNFQAKTYKIGSTINLGNGTTAAASTRGGIVLQGSGCPNQTDIQPYSPNVATWLLWSGTTTAMIQLNGVVHGCGIKDMMLDGGTTAQYGMWLSSACFGNFENISIRNCNVGIVTTVNASGLANNCQNNRFHGIFINVPTRAQAQGITLSGTVNMGNSCFNDFENICIQLPATGECYGVYLKAADTNYFRNLLIVGGSASGVAVTFDYTSASPYDNFPECNMFYGADVVGNNLVQWTNVGTGNVYTRPNALLGLGSANGGWYPDIDNLDVGLPQRVHIYSALNLGPAGVGDFTLMTPRVPGLFRLSYMLFIQTSGGGSGSAQPQFYCTTQATSQIFGGNVVNTAGNNSNGSFTMFCDNGQAIGMNVAVANASAALRYGVYVTIERLI